jgi:hypothetical protein
MKRALTSVALLLAVPLSVAACLWDRDTPSDEAKGLPEVIAVLTGRFPRNPPLYFEMRLTRMTAHLQTHLDDLAAYDDAGVACDRLGRGDQAIAWMKKKREQLDRLDASAPQAKEHRYRYHANLGTFLVHQWVRQGGDRNKIADVKQARDEIAAAIAINPNAHFGREKYQLHVIDWIINPPAAAGSEYLPNFLNWSPLAWSDVADPKEADDAVRGIAGLIVLGNAWESVDIFHALNIALQHDTLGFTKEREGGRNTLAYLAWLRCRELIDAGKNSMLPDAPKGEALKAFLLRPNFVEADGLLDPAFIKLRAEADAWQKTRTEFMLRRLKEGRHPDIDAGFWEGYTETAAPALPTTSVTTYSNERRALRERLALAVIIGVPTVTAIFFFGLSALRSKRARREKVGHSEEFLA